MRFECQKGEVIMTEKVDVRPEWWDNIFAPSSCLVLITTIDRQGSVNAAAFGTCTRVCHEPMYIAFTCSADKDTAGDRRIRGQRGPVRAGHARQGPGLRAAVQARRERA